MFEDRKEFGVVNSNLKQKIDSYLSVLYSLSLKSIDEQFIPQNMFKRGDADVFERSYKNAFNQRNLPHALVFKAAYKEALNTEVKGGKFVVTTGAGNIKNRLESLIHDIATEAYYYVDGTNLGFIESLDDEELKQQVDQAYKDEDPDFEDELAAVIFYTSVLYLKHETDKVTMGPGPDPVDPEV